MKTDEGRARLGRRHGGPGAKHVYAPSSLDRFLPTCPKCQKWISESHYQRHLRRCGTTHQARAPVPLRPLGQHPQVESPDRGITYGHPVEDRGRNWTKLMAAFVIFLLIGSVAVFFVLYALSLL